MSALTTLQAGAIYISVRGLYLSCSSSLFTKPNNRRVNVSKHIPIVNKSWLPNLKSAFWAVVVVGRGAWASGEHNHSHQADPKSCRNRKVRLSLGVTPKTVRSDSYTSKAKASSAEGKSKDIEDCNTESYHLMTPNFTTLETEQHSPRYESMEEISIKDEEAPPTRPRHDSHQAGDRTQEYIVDFDGPNDSADPLNWSPLYKWSLIILISILSLIV